MQYSVQWNNERISKGESRVWSKRNSVTGLALFSIQSLKKPFPLLLNWPNSLKLCFYFNWFEKLKNYVQKMSNTIIIWFIFFSQQRPVKRAFLSHAEAANQCWPRPARDLKQPIGAGHALRSWYNLVGLKAFDVPSNFLHLKSCIKFSTQFVCWSNLLVNSPEMGRRTYLLGLLAILLVSCEYSWYILTCACSDVQVLKQLFAKLSWRKKLIC